MLNEKVRKSPANIRFSKSSKKNSAWVQTSVLQMVISTRTFARVVSAINICSRSSFNRATLPFNMNPLETVKRHEQKSEVRPKLFERRTCTCFSLVHGSRRRMKRHRCDMQNDGAVDSPTLTLRWGEFESLLYGQTDPNVRGLSLPLSKMTATSRIDR